MSKYKYSANQKWTLASSASGAAMQAMDLMFLSLAMKPMVQSLGITNAQGGSIASITTFGMLFGSLLFGYLADNYGRVKVFMYSIWLFALATAGISFAHDITTIYFLRFLAGMGSGAEFGAGITLITENFKGHHVATFTSYAESFGELGAIFASVLAAWILPTHGWHMLFLFGLIPVILAFLVRLNLKENPRFVHNLKERKAAKDKKASILMLFQNRHMVFLTIAMTIMYMIDGASYYGLMNWMPTIMQKQLHINIMQSSLFMVSTIFGVMLGMLIFGKMMDKLGAKKAFSFFFGCSIFVVYLLKFSNSAISLLIASTLVGFFAEAF